jgi:hypothetical protein
MEFEKTTLEIYGVTIQEPVTALTNFLISGVCMFAFFALKKPGTCTSLLRYYFAAMAVAMVYSGLFGHAFQFYFSFSWKVPGWLLSMFSVTLLERAAIQHAKPILSRQLFNFFTFLNSLELIMLVIIVLATFNFKFVEAHAVYGLLVIVVPFELFIYRNSRAKSSRLFLIAVGISTLAAIVHFIQFSPHRWFNHLDLSHVLMAISACYFFLAGQKLNELPHGSEVVLVPCGEEVSMGEFKNRFDNKLE